MSYHDLFIDVCPIVSPISKDLSLMSIEKLNEKIPYCVPIFFFFFFTYKLFINALMCKYSYGLNKNIQLKIATTQKSTSIRRAISKVQYHIVYTNIQCYFKII